MALALFPTGTCKHTMAEMGPDLFGGYILEPRSPFGFLWLTDLDVPFRDALGLTSNILDCDRTEFQLRLSDPSHAKPWTEVRRDYPELWNLERAYGAQPMHWYVSRQNELAELVVREAPRAMTPRSGHRTAGRPQPGRCPVLPQYAAPPGSPVCGLQSPSPGRPAVLAWSLRQGDHEARADHTGPHVLDMRSPGNQRRPHHPPQLRGQRPGREPVTGLRPLQLTPGLQRNPPPGRALRPSPGSRSRLAGPFSIPGTLDPYRQVVRLNR